MIVLTERIASPPTIALADEEAARKLADELVQDDRWVKNIIDGLAGILRDVKH